MPKNRDFHCQSVLRWLSFFVPVFVIASIWLPQFSHYYVRLESMPRVAIEAARLAPAENVLSEISKYRVMSEWRDAAPREVVLAEADAILQGRYRLGQTLMFQWPFDPNDLDRGSSAWQLHFACFVVPDRLIKAYVLTGKEIYFEKALEFITAWGDYENSVWLPRGLLWNDHTVAERIYVIVDFWRTYRAHPRYDVTTAERILSMVQRYTKLLVKSDHFTFATNHGVMQNLALMHASIALPQLPSIQKYQAVARTRIQRQFGFFLSPDGPVLEHSAFYHRFGLGLIGMFTRYMVLIDQALPRDWELQYVRSLDFFAMLRRPDGTLPMLGDTYAHGDPKAPPVFPGNPPDLAGPLIERTDWRPPHPLAIYPLAGYSILWNGLSHWPDGKQLSQLMVTWSHFSKHGHQRAQELSVLFWAAGQTWWTNTGYWSYDERSRAEAESWQGSGAPYALGESSRVRRFTELKGFAHLSDVAAFDLERKSAEGLRVRRQIIQVSPSLWIALDESEDRSGRPVHTTWTTFPNVVLESTEHPNAFHLKSNISSAGLDVRVVGAEGVTVAARKGETSPFAGWVWVDGKTAANALVIRHQRNLDWSAVVWSTGNDAQSLVGVPRVTWKRADDWSATIGFAAGKLEITRRGNVIQVGDVRLDMQAPAHTSSARDSIQKAYSALQREFPRFADVPTYRTKMTYALLMVLGVQGVVYYIARRRFSRYAPGFLGALIAIWLGGGLWLHAVYFKI